MCYIHSECQDPGLISTRLPENPQMFHRISHSNNVLSEKEHLFLKFYFYFDSCTKDLTLAHGIHQKHSCHRYKDAHHTLIISYIVCSNWYSTVFFLLIILAYPVIFACIVNEKESKILQYSQSIPLTTLINWSLTMINAKTYMELGMCPACPCGTSRCFLILKIIY